MAELKDEQPEARHILRSIGRGLAGRCPNCGKGRMFSGFLTLKSCEVCGEDLAERDPSLLLPLVVGLVVVAIFAHIYFVMEIFGIGSPLIYISILFPVTIVVSLLTIRPFKGALVGLAWAVRSGRTPQE